MAFFARSNEVLHPSGAFAIAIGDFDPNYQSVSEHLFFEDSIVAGLCQTVESSVAFSTLSIFLVSAVKPCSLIDHISPYFENCLQSLNHSF